MALTFVVHFLYNLWCTPYLILEERLGDFEKSLEDIRSELPSVGWGQSFMIDVKVFLLK